MYVCLLLATAAPALAQQRLFAVMASEVVEIDPRPSSLGTVIARVPLPAGTRAGSSQDAVSFQGGQSLAWVAEYEPGFYPQSIVLLDTRSGAVQQFTFPDFFPARVLGTDGINRLLVLGTNEAGDDIVLVVDARSGSVHFLNVGNLNSLSQAITYAPASDALFVARPRGPGADTYHDVDVIQASTGALFKTLDIAPVSANLLSTNAAGTRLFVTDALDGTFAFDVLSGAQSGSNSTPPLRGTLFTPTVDEHRNRLLVNIVIPDGGNPEFVAWRGISAFSADSMQFLGRVQLPQLPLPAPTQDTKEYQTEHLDVSGLSATMFVLQGVGSTYKYRERPDTCDQSQLIGLDAATGHVRRIVPTTATLGPGACAADLVRITEPAPPSPATADVSGHQVTLQWQAPLGATQYEVEAGAAPGLVNLVISANEPQLVVNDVPPGVYYLRVRAINTIGRSGASQEIQVIVP